MNHVPYNFAHLIHLPCSFLCSYSCRWYTVCNYHWEVGPFCCSWGDRCAVVQTQPGSDRKAACEVKGLPPTRGYSIWFVDSADMITSILYLKTVRTNSDSIQYFHELTAFVMFYNHNFIFSWIICLLSGGVAAAHAPVQRTMQGKLYPASPLPPMLLDFTLSFCAAKLCIA
jgi:hypothetical protein